MIINGKEVIPLQVHFWPQAPTETDEVEFLPSGLNQQEQETFYRCARALKPRTFSKYLMNQSSNRIITRVEPTFKRTVLRQGTHITINMHQVMIEDILVQVRGRTLIVTGLVRDTANSDGAFRRSSTAAIGNKGTPRVEYTYQTGVTKRVDLESLIAGYRKDCVELFLPRVDNVQENVQEDVEMREASHSS